MKYAFSEVENNSPNKEYAFYPLSLKESYEQNNSWPNNYVEVDEDIYQTYKGQIQPTGKMIGADNKGMPCWVDVPAPALLSNDELAKRARNLRDLFISSTDSLASVSDYTINDEIISDEKKADLLATRLRFKAWTGEAGWPLISLPSISDWLLIEAVNNGYVVPNWPEEVDGLY